MIYSSKQVAEAVCSQMEGATARNLLANHRGSPRAALLRGVAMWYWREQFPAPASYTATGAAFGRDRRTVVRAIARAKNFTKPHIKKRIGELLSGAKS